MNAILLSLLAALIAFALTALYTRAMATSSRLEFPNERGMHAVAVPSGAGVAIITAIFMLWPFSHTLVLDRIHLVLLAATAGLVALSWIDDQYRLSPAIRLAAHAATVLLLLAALGTEPRVLPALPLYVERALLVLAWLWFINLFNFMDGIDGLAGSEAIAIAAGYLAVITVTGSSSPLFELAMVIAAASAGYLAWNWHPAKVFMGDTGSIPLGFLLGWLMIDLACRGLWPAAVILPLYFVADATVTLLKRLRRGEKPWQPHRQHYYQRAVLGGAAQQAIVWRVNVVNALLLALAVLSLRFPVLALVAAVTAAAGLLAHLEMLARSKPM